MQPGETRMETRQCHLSARRLRSIEPADAFAVANNGWTAIHYACANGHDAAALEIMTLLKAAGETDAAILELVWRRDCDGRTAFDVARTRGHEATAVLLHAESLETCSSARASARATGGA